MPIKVSCKCGQNFTAKDELAGQTLLCPKCHQPLTIGAETQQTAAHKSSGGGTIADLFDEAGIAEVQGPRCPQCGAALKPSAVLCVACGLNLQSRERLAEAKVRKAGQRGHGESAEVLLEKAAERIEEDKLEEVKTRKQGLPWWVLLFALICLIGFTATMLVIGPRLQEQYGVFGPPIMGLFAFACGTSVLTMLYCWTQVLIHSFSDRMYHFLLNLLCPGYWFFYMALRMNRLGEIMFLYMIAWILVPALYWLCLALLAVIVSFFGAMQAAKDSGAMVFESIVLVWILLGAMLAALISLPIAVVKWARISTHAFEDEQNLVHAVLCCVSLIFPLPLIPWYALVYGFMRSRDLQTEVIGLLTNTLIVFSPLILLIIMALVLR